MNNNDRMSMSETDVLDICSEIEDTVAILYRYFSKLYSSTREVSDVFLKIALEEDQHSNQFSLAYRLHGTGMKAVKADPARTKAILDKLKELYAAVQANPPGIKQALNLSIKIETTLADYHMKAMVEFQDPNLSNLFVSMKNNDDAHLQMLTQVARSYQ